MYLHPSNADNFIEWRSDFWFEAFFERDTYYI